MKQKPSWLTRVLTMFLGAVAIWMLLTAPVTLKINNFHGMIRSVVAKEIKASDDDNAKAAWSLMKMTGADELLLQQVPRRFSYQTSYWSVFELSQHNGQIEQQTDQYLVSSLTKTGISKSDARKLVALLPKTELRQLEDEIDSYLHKYQTYFLIVVGILILSMLLVLLGHGLGIWLLSLLDLGLFALLLIVTSNIEPAVQADFYRGIQVTVGSAAYLSLVLSLLGLIIWHFGKKRVRKHD